MKCYLPLSKLDKKYNLEELLDYLIDNNYVGIINDLTNEPHIEYDLDDLIVVWNKFEKLWK